MSAKHTTIFTTMSALAQEYGAINLAQGFPGFDCDPRLLERAYQYMREGQNQYAPMAGAMQLRQAIAHKVFKQYQVQYDIEEEICVTAGATEAVHVAMQSLLEPGDEVLILEPAFDLYVAAVKKAGAVPVFVRLSFPDFQIDWELLQSTVTPKTKLVVINSPHNPTGAILHDTDLDRLEALVLKHNLYILSDEVYEHIVYNGQRHVSVIQREALRARAFVVFSLGKTFHVTGWHVGYCLAPKLLMETFKLVHQYVTFSAATPLQLACADLLQDESSYTALSEFFQGKKDYFLEQMRGTGFEPLHCSGTYFQLMSYKDVYQEDDVALAQWLTREKKVASIPISVFYHDRPQQQVLRFCFAKENEDLKRAAERLK